MSALRLRQIIQGKKPLIRTIRFLDGSFNIIKLNSEPDSQNIYSKTRRSKDLQGSWL